MSVPPASPESASLSLEEELVYVKRKLYSEIERLKEKNRLALEELGLAREKIKCLEKLAEPDGRKFSK